LKAAQTPSMGPVPGGVRRPCARDLRAADTGHRWPCQTSEMRNEELAAGQHRGGDHPEQPPTLTVAEAAQACGVSTSTIRRYLRAGRFPSARQEPSPLPGQPGQWRIPTEDVLGAGLDRHRPTPSGHAQERQATGEPAGAWAARDRVHALEQALELERTRRQAAEVLAAERARTILALETALRALEHRRPEPAAESPRQLRQRRRRLAPGKHPGQPHRPGSCRWFQGREGPRASSVKRSGRRSSGGR
jgi:excisionase family DNA binding protein